MLLNVGFCFSVFHHAPLLLIYSSNVAFLEKYGLKKMSKVDSTASRSNIMPQDTLKGISELASTLLNPSAEKLTEATESPTPPLETSPSNENIHEAITKNESEKSKQALPPKSFESTLQENLASLSCEQMELIEAALDGKNVFFTGAI